MEKYRRVLTFFCLFFILAGVLIWATVYDDKYILESYNPKQGKNIYREIVDEGILTVYEIEYGVYEIQLISNNSGVNQEADKIIYNASAQQYMFNIGLLENQDNSLIIFYGVVSNPNAIRGKFISLDTEYSQDVPVNKGFYIFTTKEVIDGSYQLEFYDKHNNKVEEVGSFAIGRIGKAQYTKEDAISDFWAHIKLNHNNPDNFEILDCVLAEDDNHSGLKAVIAFYDKEKNNSCNLAFIFGEDLVQEICFAVNETEGIKTFEIADGSKLTYIGSGTVTTSIRKIETNEIYDYAITISHDEAASATNYKVVAEKREK
ncbi:MAG: hypothetical protein GXW85_07625 [Clostridia bacterium]|nr:hypothetical protein [Clostridia bacterium]